MTTPPAADATDWLAAARAMAAAAGLTLPAETEPGVAANLATLAEHARRVEAEPR